MNISELLTEVLQICEREQRAEGLHLVYHYRAVARYREAMFAAAVQDARAALEVEDRYVPAMCCAAAALDALRRPHDASLMLQRALKLEPSSQEVSSLNRRVAQSLARQALQQAAGCSKGTSDSSAMGQPSASTREEEEATRKFEGSGPAVVNLHAREGTGGSASTAASATSTAGAPGSCSRHFKAIVSPRGLALDPAVFPAGLRLDSLGKEHMFRPSPDGMNTNLLILLHGLGDRPKPYDALARRMALPQTASLALSGPLAVPETDGGRAWLQVFDSDFEFIEPRAGETRRTQSLNASVRLLTELIHRLVDTGWSHRNIHLFGFSQGGTTALEVHMEHRGAQRLGGCVSVSGTFLEELLGTRVPKKSPGSILPDVHGVKQPVSATGSQGCGPLLITYGDRDQTVAQSLVDRTLAFLRTDAWCGPSSCRLHTVPGKGHGMVASEQEMRALMSFWAETLGNRPPGEDVVEIQT